MLNFYSFIYYYAIKQTKFQISNRWGFMVASKTQAGFL